MYYDDTKRFNNESKTWESIAHVVAIKEQLESQGLKEFDASPDWMTGTSRRQNLMRQLRYDSGATVVLVDRITPELRYALTYRANRKQATLVVAPRYRYKLLVQTALQAQLQALEEHISISDLFSDVEAEARQQYAEAIEILQLLGEELPLEDEIDRYLDVYAPIYGVTVSHMGMYDYVPTDRTGKIYRRSVTAPEFSAKALAYALTRYHQQNSEPDHREDPEFTTTSPALYDLLYST